MNAHEQRSQCTGNMPGFGDPCVVMPVFHRSLFARVSKLYLHIEPLSMRRSHCQSNNLRKLDAPGARVEVLHTRSKVLSDPYSNRLAFVAETASMWRVTEII